MMIYIWAAVIATALVLEFVSMELVTIWFSISGIVSLILAICNVDTQWQVLAFLIIAIVLIVALRKFTLSKLHGDTHKTNSDKHINTIVTLVTEIPAKDGIGTIKLNGVTWNVTSTTKIPANSKVKLVELQGNTFKVIKSKENEK